MGEQGWGRGAASLDGMRIIVADCCAEYTGRLSASLPLAKRVLLIKADNSLLIFSEIGSYKPLNWMSAPCSIRDITPDHADDDVDTEVPQKVIRASADKSNDVLEVTLQHIYSDESYDLGEDPGLIKDGVEDHLQKYLAEQIERIGKGAKLVRREYPTAIGPVDIMAIDGNGEHVAIEIKRNGGIAGEVSATVSGSDPYAMFENCYNTGAISCNGYVAGIAGYLSTAGTHFSGCFNAGHISAATINGGAALVDAGVPVAREGAQAARLAEEESHESGDEVDEATPEVTSAAR